MSKRKGIYQITDDGIRRIKNSTISQVAAARMLGVSDSRLSQILKRGGERETIQKIMNIYSLPEECMKERDFVPPAPVPAPVSEETPADRLQYDIIKNIVMIDDPEYLELIRRLTDMTMPPDQREIIKGSFRLFLGKK